MKLEWKARDTHSNSVNIVKEYRMVRSVGGTTLSIRISCTIPAINISEPSILFSLDRERLFVLFRLRKPRGARFSLNDIAPIVGVLRLTPPTKK